MSGPIFSPDGKFLWTGEEWIPTPPKENILEESELDEDIIETVSSETNIQTEELAETAVHFDLNNDKKIDKEEVEMAAKSLTSEIIPFEQWKSQNSEINHDDDVIEEQKLSANEPVPFEQWSNEQQVKSSNNSSEVSQNHETSDALPQKEFDLIKKSKQYLEAIKQDRKKMSIAIGIASVILISIIVTSMLLIFSNPKVELGDVTSNTYGATAGNEDILLNFEFDTKNDKISLDDIRVYVYNDYGEKFECKRFTGYDDIFDGDCFVHIEECLFEPDYYQKTETSEEEQSGMNDITSEVHNSYNKAIECQANNPKLKDNTFTIKELFTNICDGGGRPSTPGIKNLLGCQITLDIDLNGAAKSNFVTAMGGISVPIADFDGDGFDDVLDKLPRIATEWDDTDSDGIGNNIDTDDDGDLILDENDIWPLDRCASSDYDGDSKADTIVENCMTNITEDYDDDNDGYGDTFDIFPYDATEWYDSDSDGVGDNRDLKTNGDANLTFYVEYLATDSEYEYDPGTYNWWNEYQDNPPDLRMNILIDWSCDNIIDNWYNSSTAWDTNLVVGSADGLSVTVNVPDSSSQICYIVRILDYDTNSNSLTLDYVNGPGESIKTTAGLDSNYFNNMYYVGEDTPTVTMRVEVRIE